MSTKNNRSIIDFPDEYIVLDLETTGLSPKYDEIIEISALLVKDGSINSTFSSFVKPTSYYFVNNNDDGDAVFFEGDWIKYIPYFITFLTGITNQMVKDAPHLASVLPSLLEFISDRIVVGHNIPFDINFIRHNCEGFDNQFVNTIRLSHKLFPDKKHHRLVDVAKYLSIEMDESKAHRSTYDCEITFLAYQKMIEIIKSNYNSFDDFKKLYSSNYNSTYNPRNLIPEDIEIDPDSPFYGKECIFTGSLEKMVRKVAQQVIVNLGGTCGSSVTKKTNYLILGNYDYCKSIKGGKSSKHKKAEELKLKGQDIEIIPEDVFYQMLNMN